MNLKLEFLGKVGVFCGPVVPGGVADCLTLSILNLLPRDFLNGVHIIGWNNLGL